MDELLTFIVKEGGKITAEKGKHDDLVMSLALAIFGFKSIIETGTIEHIAKIPHKEALPLPSVMQKVPVQSFGGMTQEDLKWLMK